MDVCGPHFIVVYLLQAKDEVLEYFIEYDAKVTAYFGTKNARVRCYNGGEENSSDFKKSLSKERNFIGEPCSLKSTTNLCRRNNEQDIAGQIKISNPVILE